MILIYSTFSSKTEAQKITQALIKNKLAACANVWPIDSVYRWKGRMVKEKEFVALLKTSKRNYKSVEKYILTHHSYDTPAIMEIPLGRITERYDKWLRSCL